MLSMKKSLPIHSLGGSGGEKLDKACANYEEDADAEDCGMAAEVTWAPGRAPTFSSRATASSRSLAINTPTSRRSTDTTGHARSSHFFVRPLSPVTHPVLALLHRAQSQPSRPRSPALDQHQSTDLNRNGPLQRSLPLGCAVRLWWRILYGSDRRRSVARCEGFPQLAIRRTQNRRHHGHQGARADPGRQLRRVGRALLDVRLRGQGHPQEGGPVERHHRRLLHRRLAGGAWRRKGRPQRCHRLRHPARRHRGRRHRLPAHDGGEHAPRRAAAAAEPAAAAGLGCDAPPRDGVVVGMTDGRTDRGRRLRTTMRMTTG